MRSLRLAAIAPAGALLLASCTMVPRYQRPAAPVSAAWPASAQAGAAAAAPGRPVADLGWRDVFGDPRLQALITLALQNNRDLRVASLNVELAQAQYQIQRAQLLPTLAGAATMTRSHTIAPFSSTGAAYTSSAYTVGLGVSAWELDLFGRIRSLKQAALEAYFSTDEAQRSAHLTLVAEVADQYLALRALDDQVALAEETLKTVQASYDLTQRTFAAGRSSELDLRTAETQVQTAQFNLYVYQLQRAQAENALVLLVGEPLPTDLPPAMPLDAQPLLADLPPGLPSDLLERRPDILGAEHDLRSANANIGAARAAFFPTITLTGFAGTGSVDLLKLFSGGSGLWSFSPQITLPIFTGGRNRANLEASEVRKRIEVARYEKAIQVAFREVADALAARSSLEQQLAVESARVEAEQRRYALSELRYRKGVDSYLNVLTAQRDLYSAQQQLIQSRLARLANLVALYKALGGGWLERSAGSAAAASR